VKFLGLAAYHPLFYVLGGESQPFNPLVGAVSFPRWCLSVTLVGSRITNAFNLIDALTVWRRARRCFHPAAADCLPHPGTAGVAGWLDSLVRRTGGFLRYNFIPPRFSWEIQVRCCGFVLAALFDSGAQKATTAVAVAIPLLAFALPVWTPASRCARFVDGKRSLKETAAHTPHAFGARLVTARVVLVLYGVSAVFGLWPMLFVNAAVA